MARNSTAKLNSDMVMSCIVQFIKDNQYPPSIRQLGECLEIGSPSVVQRWLKILEQEGRITREPSQPRSIRIVR